MGQYRRAIRKDMKAIRMFIDADIKPSLKQELKLGHQNHPSDIYFYFTIDVIMKLLPRQNPLIIEGSPGDQANCKIIYQPVGQMTGAMCAYSTFWHIIRDMLLDIGFEKYAHGKYRYRL